jgi:hypothetical protein
MRFTIVTEFSQDDPGMLGDPCMVSLIENDDVLVSGDHYHNKINDHIAGFLAGVKHAGHRVYVTKVSKISEDY